MHASREAPIAQLGTYMAPPSEQQGKSVVVVFVFVVGDGRGRFCEAECQNQFKGNVEEEVKMWLMLYYIIKNV